MKQNEQPVKAARLLLFEGNAKYSERSPQQIGSA
jgi:hypothetical protein